MSQEFFDHVLYYGDGGAGTGLRGPAQDWDLWWRARCSDDEPLATAQRQGFVLASGQLTGLGVSRSAARTALRRGAWWRPMLGTVAPLRVDPDEVDDPRARLRARRMHALVAAAAILRRDEHVVAGRSAAILHGLPTRDVPSTAELAAPDDNGLGRQAATHSFGAALPPRCVSTWFGVPVTTVARTLVDLARHDRQDAIMAADAALRDRVLTASQIEREVAEAAGWPGVRQARAVLALADPLAESPLESLVRLALHDDGFPPPDLQYWIGGDRVDLCWPDRRLVLEADGRGKYYGDALWKEKRRAVRVERSGFAVERVLWSDLDAGWPAFSAGLRRYF